MKMVEYISVRMVLFAGVSENDLVSLVVQGK